MAPAFPATLRVPAPSPAPGCSASQGHERFQAAAAGAAAAWQRPQPGRNVPIKQSLVISRGWGSHCAGTASPSATRSGFGISSDRAPAAAPAPGHPPHHGSMPAAGSHHRHGAAGGGGSGTLYPAKNNPPPPASLDVFKCLQCLLLPLSPSGCLPSFSGARLRLLSSHVCCRRMGLGFPARVWSPVPSHTWGRGEGTATKGFPLPKRYLFQ